MRRRSVFGVGGGCSDEGPQLRQLRVNQTKICPQRHLSPWQCASTYDRQLSSVLVTVVAWLPVQTVNGRCGSPPPAAPRSSPSAKALSIAFDTPSRKSPAATAAT